MTDQPRARTQNRQALRYRVQYGRDLVTGAQNDEAAFRAMNPVGRAVLKSAAYIPAPEGPNDDGSVFVPFHYGSSDRKCVAGGQRAHEDQLGPGVQATPAEVRRGAGHTCGGRQ
jgi:hypothetical protein